MVLEICCASADDVRIAAAAGAQRVELNSEKADTAMAFKITEPVVRFMIAVPVGILVGMLFFSIQYDYGFTTSVLWLVFGGLLGGFLCHGIIEAFYKGDIKKCLSHKVQMLVTMVLAAVIPVLFVFEQKYCLGPFIWKFYQVY